MRTCLLSLMAGAVFAALAGTAAVAWELDKPIATYWGQTTWWPGATFEQIVDYSNDGNFNLIWGSHTETFVRAEQYGLGTLMVHHQFWDYQYGDLNDPSKKAVIDASNCCLLVKATLLRSCS